MKATELNRLNAAQARRAELRTGDESKCHAFHFGAFLMERNAKRKLGFTLFQVALDAEILMRLGKRLAAYSLADCNTGLNDRQEVQRQKVVVQAKEVAGWYDLEAHCYGDPRGYVLRLDGPDVQKNGWGDGFGVA
jgi:hypothetical protein